MKADYFVSIITHGNLAFSLKEVLEQLGAPSIPMHCYSNKKEAMHSIEKEITSLLSAHDTQKGVLFVDFMGGSCWLSANRLKKDFGNLVVISGVNLPMLLSFSMNYQRLSWPDLLQKIITDAKKGIVER